jgi:hypothetical protein
MEFIAGLDGSGGQPTAFDENRMNGKILPMTKIKPVGDGRHNDRYCISQFVNDVLHILKFILTYRQGEELQSAVVLQQ